MTALSATQSSSTVQSGGLVSGGRTTGMNLLIRLGMIELTGRQMFERDCLSFYLETWLAILAGDPIPEAEQIGAADLLGEIADIRALPATNSEEVGNVDSELLEVASDIEAYVRLHAPTLQ